jgi:RNA polymerase sigma factor (TIGR02999 family)
VDHSNDDRDITRLLDDWRRGEPDAEARLMEVVYGALRNAANGIVTREGRGIHKLQRTELLNQAYARLRSLQSTEWTSREHFFGMATKAMRQVVIDEARKFRTKKRGEGAVALSLSDLEPGRGVDMEMRLALYDAIDELGRVSPLEATIFVDRYWGNLSRDEIAALHGVAIEIVDRDLRHAKMWLRRQLGTPPRRDNDVVYERVARSPE